MTEPLSTRDRIIHAAATLLAEGGRDAVSTRAVGAAAGVQAPTIYRTFGDMQGLLDEVASYGFAEYLRTKVERVRAADPVDDLRAGWDLHVGFGVANPAFYVLMYGEPRTGAAQPEAARRAEEILHQLVGAIAEVGRLRVGVERAAQMVHSASCGVALTLIGTKPEDRDPELSTRVREGIIAAITTDAEERAAAGPASHAIALKAMLADTGLTGPEQALLAQWLDQIAARG